MPDVDWKDLVRSVAPALGAALNGPLAGIATRYIAEKMLEKPDATEADIQTAMSVATSDTLGKLKDLDSQFSQEMARLGIDVFRLAPDDQKAAKGSSRVNTWSQLSLTGVFIVGYFALVMFLLHPGLNNEKWLETMTTNQWLQGVVTTILGVLTASVPQILGFWFGSSLGAKDKPDAAG